MTDADCSSLDYHNNPWFTLTDVMFCAGFPEGTTDSCQVESRNLYNKKRFVDALCLSRATPAAPWCPTATSTTRSLASSPTATGGARRRGWSGFTRTYSVKSSFTQPLIVGVHTVLHFLFISAIVDWFREQTNLTRGDFCPRR